MKITLAILHGSGIYAIGRLSLISPTRCDNRTCPPCCRRCHPPYTFREGRQCPLDWVCKEEIPWEVRKQDCHCPFLNCGPIGPIRSSATMDSIVLWWPNLMGSCNDMRSLGTGFSQPVSSPGAVASLPSCLTLLTLSPQVSPKTS